MTTFVDLRDMRVPPFAQVLAILENYAHIGAPIESKVVISVIRKMMLTGEERVKLANMAKEGQRLQQDTLLLKKEALEYEKIYNFLTHAPQKK